RVMDNYRQRYDVLVGFSGHERGIAVTEAAATLGACVVERHFTKDRTLPGPDHAASLEPIGLETLVRDIRHIEMAMGSGQKTVAARARKVRLLCVDVDGVLTDAGMYYGPEGEVLKKFNTRDGMGLARVREAGVAVAIISGEDSAIVHARATKLRIDDVYVNAK